MFCRNCGKKIDVQAVICVNCGVSSKNGKNFCQNCGEKTNPNAEVCIKCGVRLIKNGDKSFFITLLLCILLGGLGIHRFYTGHIVIGVIQMLTFGGCYIWTLIDLIMIVTDSYKDSNGNPLVKD